jgi:outer membrane protein assembly factor BamB
MYVCVENQLVMFSPGTTSPQWKYAMGDPAPRSPAIGPDGIVRVHSMDGHLHAVDADGRAAFEPVAIGRPLGWAAPLVDRRCNTWICRADGGVAEISPAGQTESRPFVRTRRRFDCSGVIRDDVLYLGCEDHYLCAFPLNADCGENRWADDTDLGRTGGAIQCPLAVTPAGELLAVSQDDHLYYFAPNGRPARTIALPGMTFGSPICDDRGVVFLGVSERLLGGIGRGALIAVQTATSRILWRYQAESAIESTPVLGDDGILYFGDNQGTIHAVDRDGRAVWRSELQSPVRSAGVLWDGLLAFGLDDGSLALMECSSQRLFEEGWPKLLGTLDQAGCVS